MKRAAALLCVVAVCAHAQDGGARAVSELLVLTGAQLETARDLPCTLTDETTIEELDSDKKPKAREIHTATLTRLNGETTRTPVAVKKDLGELDSRMRPKPDSELSKDEKERRKHFKTPFHNSEQAKFRFSQVGAPKNGQVTVAFEPLKADVERGIGVATLDAESGALLSINSKPSKFPTFLSELDMQMNFSTTACGQQPTRIDVRGEGGFLFIKKRFRSVTVLKDHAVTK